MTIKTLPIIKVFTALIISSFITLSQAEKQIHYAETILLSSMSEIKQGDLSSALTEIKSLTADKPNFKLAQMIKADLLAIKSGNLELLNNIREDNYKRLNHLMFEAEVRWQSYSLNPEQHLINRYVLKHNLASNIVLISTKEHRLYVYDYNKNQIASFYASIGRAGVGKTLEGDLKTPLGIYLIEEELYDKNLIDLYGVGALTLNYPNKWDRKNERTGHGIWLHGTASNTFSRSPLTSRGCIVLNNSSMSLLLSEFGLKENTVVIITDKNPFDSLLVNLNKEYNAKQTIKDIKSWLYAEASYEFNWNKVNIFAYPGEEDLYYINFIIAENGKDRLVEKFWQRPLAVASN